MIFNSLEPLFGGSKHFFDRTLRNPSFRSDLGLFLNVLMTLVQTSTLIHPYEHILCLMESSIFYPYPERAIFSCHKHLHLFLHYNIVTLSDKLHILGPRKLYNANLYKTRLIFYRPKYPHDVINLQHTLYIVIATVLETRTNRSTNQQSFCSDIFSSASISLPASPRRRWDGAHVTAVTWPCQFSLLPRKTCTIIAHYIGAVNFIGNSVMTRHE